MRHDKVQSACLITGPGQSRKTADLRSATEIGKVDTRFTLIRHGGRAEDWVGSKKKHQTSESLETEVNPRCTRMRYGEPA